MIRCLVASCDRLQSEALRVAVYRSLQVAYFFANAARASCGGEIRPIAALHVFRLHTRSLLPSALIFAPVRVGLLQAEQTNNTLLIGIGISFDKRPPCGLRWLRRMCL